MTAKRRTRKRHADLAYTLPSAQGVFEAAQRAAAQGDCEFAVTLIGSGAQQLGLLRCNPPASGSARRAWEDEQAGAEAAYHTALSAVTARCRRP